MVKSFQAEHDIINLVYYVSLNYDSVIRVDDKGINEVSTFVRLKMVNKDYFFVKGLENCIALFIELEIDTKPLIDNFKYVVNSYKGSTPLMLNQFEISLMNNVEV